MKPTPQPRPPRPHDDIAENLEQSQESTEAVVHAPEVDLSTLDQQLASLIENLRRVPNGDLVADMVGNSMKLLRDDTNRGDLKLINKAMKEIRYSLKIFAPYRQVRKVSIFGSARTPETDDDYLQAMEFGRGMAAAGWMVITGAGGGIMAAGHGGAGVDPSFGLAIRLPFEQRTNETIAKDKKLIHFNYFFTRKLMFVRSSHALALFPGGFGTMDEGFEVLTLIQTGKSTPMPIVMLDKPGGTFWQGWDEYAHKELLGRKFVSPEDFHLYKIVKTVDEAIAECRHFYSNYHSIRYVNDELVIRLNRAPTPKQLDYIAGEFASLKTDGEYRVTGALPIEKDEPALAHLPRLVFHFNRKDHGRFRQLIDHLNSLE